jgi:hypothetical protein
MPRAQETPTHVRLELDAINRIVTVERKHVQAVGEWEGRSILCTGGHGEG